MWALIARCAVVLLLSLLTACNNTTTHQKPTAPAVDAFDCGDTATSPPTGDTCRQSEPTGEKTSEMFLRVKKNKPVVLFA
jgi:hypothetical protein